LAPPRWLLLLLGSSWLVYVGRISYGLYVWHVLVAEVTTRALGQLGWSTSLSTRAALWLGLLLAVAAVSHRWFEAPLLRWKDRIP
jgi:peptidoglycan/LPS O-acetylase OafA/YrhL